MPCTVATVHVLATHPVSLARLNCAWGRVRHARAARADRNTKDRIDVHVQREVLYMTVIVYSMYVFRVAVRES